ncbi:putative MFS-type transporter YhjX [Limihaloglobus sulfuriphilus]|uniref:Putative MFS-type transporter YhjX n=1 Tax=Limihaloglobus sulfuriphilus TaxID=1851148 RepID=A0A1Q2MFP1_9BACT|nr:MFS transporter [Limihaloglobus sulfuriphilus]AQQ71525.1 putative MFS-type transporter YhjX [Limihaloglobus sulfuriphilus]
MESNRKDTFVKNRWVILAAGIVIQIILGGIYAWSIFVPQLIDTKGLTKAQCGSVFGLSIAVFTVAAIFGGRLLSSKGPRLTALTGSLLFAGGYLLASFAGTSYLLLLLGISILSGAGIGFGYVCPLSVGMRWFPRRKGLITGVAVAGFGGGAVILSEAAEYFLYSGMDVLVFFRWIAINPGALLVLASMLLEFPPEAKIADKNDASYAGLKTRPFALCVIGIFAGTFSGLLVIGNLTPMAVAAAYDPAIAVSVFALGNAAGRIKWGFWFDKFHYWTIPVSLAGFAGFMLMFHMADAYWLFLVSVFGMGFCFGANFVIYASSISRRFGLDSFPLLYPICFLAYGLAGLIGPAVGGYLADRSGSYTLALYLSMAILAAAAVVTFAGQKRFSQS